MHTQGALREAERVPRDGIATRAGDADQEYALARARRDLANVLRDRGDLEQADHWYRDALARLSALGGDSDVQFSLTNLEYARLQLLGLVVATGQGWSLGVSGGYRWMGDFSETIGTRRKYNSVDVGTGIGWMWGASHGQ